MTKIKENESNESEDSVGIENEDNLVLEEAMDVLKGMVEEDVIEKTKEQELTEQLQRLQAEFENFRKRTEKEKTEIRLNANAGLITELLRVLDDFELSLKHREDQGVRMIYDEMNNVLTKAGMKVVDIAIPFNPRVHDAIMIEDGKEHGKILEELQRGYMLNDKLLRATKVKIGRTKK